MSYTVANTDNFVRLKKPSGLTLSGLQANGIPALANDDGETTIIDYSSVESVITCLVSSQSFSFYANLDDLDTSTDFASWELHLLTDDSFTIAFPEIDELTQDAYVGGFRFYSTFNVPSGLADGKCYVLAIVSGDDVKYLSNSLKYCAQTNDRLTEIRYRNGLDIFNYGYENLDTFYNRFYIELAYIQPEYITNSEGYDLVKGAFTEARTTTGISKRFITRSYNTEDGQAFAALAIHDTFEIKELGQWELYIRDDSSDYSQDWIGEYPLAHGEIRLRKDSTFASNKAI